MALVMMYYNNSYIDHQNGFFSWYLYAPLTPAILAEINLNGYAQVTKGQVIGNVAPSDYEALQIACISRCA